MRMFFISDSSGVWSGYLPNFEKFLMKNGSKQKKEEPGSYICNGCGKVYKWRTSMLKHRRQECGKEPQFQCPYCPKRSKQKGNLMQHIKSIHSIENISNVISNF